MGAFPSLKPFPPTRVDPTPFAQRQYFIELATFTTVRLAVAAQARISTISRFHPAPREEMVVL